MPTRLPHISDDHHFAIANVAGRAAQMDVHIRKIPAGWMSSNRRRRNILLKNLGADRVVGLLKMMKLDTFPEKPTSRRLNQRGFIFLLTNRS